MPDPLQLDYLLETLAHSTGRLAWQEYKRRCKWIDLTAADFTRKTMRDFDLSDINMGASLFLMADLAGANLTETNLALADLRGANLRNAILERANLADANLAAAVLIDARLDQADLAGCRLADAQLVGADLAGANLTNADLRGANMKYARLTGARLEGADVAGADLTGAVMDDEAPARLANFDQVKIDDRKYRQMRARPLLADSRALARVEITTPPPSEPEPEPVKRKTDRRAQKKSKDDEETTGTGRRPRGYQGEERRRGGGDIPDRDAEPDLETTVGCQAVLGVGPEASIEDVVKAFRKKAKIVHPDMVRHLAPRLQELAAEEFQRLHRAYERLTRHTTRPLQGVRWAEGVPRRTTPYEYTSAEYEKLVAVNPGNTNILYNLAWKYFEEGRHADARAGFEKLLELDPNDDDAQFNLVIVRLYAEVQLPFFG